ncbi:hypothetical protein ACFU7Z_32230 [Kitasatospora sp. NPDC057518]|uniref:hypothetical protein n=1 Tax=Kitasatospora sp. NPDC057518 TaxID=3346155 RepID=UPI0036C8A109
MPSHSWDSDPVPTRETTPSKPRRWHLAVVPLALAAVAATSAVLLQQSAPASAADTPVATDGAKPRATPLLKLMCGANGTIQSTQPITNTPTAVDVSMTNGVIERCLTENGGPELSAGTVSITGSATLSCGQVGQLTGTIVVNWSDGSGNSAGVSTINADGMQHVQADPSKNEITNNLNGVVSLDSTVLPGATVTGTLYPGADITKCSTGTISSLPDSDITLRFNSLL